MPKGIPRTKCESCAKPVSEVGALSLTGLCDDCGQRRAIENHRQLRAHSGPFFDHWRRRTLAAFGIVTVDSRESTE